MPDSTPSPSNPAAPTTASQPHGYFNKAQVEDIGIADDILTAASEDEHKTALAERDITVEYLAGLGTFITQARAKMAATGQAHSGHQPSTLNATAAERALLTALQGIQSAAKQRERMEQEDEDPATNFTVSGYLVGQRLNQSHDLLLQNTATLLGKARADQIPGYRTPESIQKVEQAIGTYQSAAVAGDRADEDSAAERIARDTLLRKINARRMAIQHAIDGLYPYPEEETHPTRRRFQIPLDRPFNG